MRHFALVATALMITAGIVGCKHSASHVGKPIGGANHVSTPIGGATSIVSSEKNFELNYDLKKTVDSARSVEWRCLCEVDRELTIDGEEYTIFKDCGPQNGNQLVSRGSQYYLISQKLRVIEKD